MCKIPYMYNARQIEEIQNYIALNFGNNESDYVAHETISEYVHTDVAVIDNQNEMKVLASFGMGARPTMSPDNRFKHIELMAFTSPDLEIGSEESMTLIKEIVRISKCPFKDNTWFGAGHTINASDNFKDMFGFEYFLFIYSGFTAQISEIGDVDYLTLLPLYKEEYNWILENGDIAFLELLLKTYDDNALILNKSRDIVIEKL